MNLRRFLLFPLILLTLLLAGAPAWAQLATVYNVRFGQSDEHVRVVIDSDQELSFDFLPVAGDPLRIVVNLPPVDWRIGDRLTSQGEGDGIGPIDVFRYVEASGSGSRLVLDLTAPVGVKRAFTLEPNGDAPHYRTVFDFVEIPQSQFYSEAAALAPAQPQVRLPSFAVTDFIGGPSVAETFATEPVADPAPEKANIFGASRKVVVIDAGHGGKDPGAIAVGGTFEKDVTLAAALELQAELEADPRYIVVLTRDDDTFVEHADRIQIARDAGADLFLSVHADAAGSRAVRGASVYTLAESAKGRVTRMSEAKAWEIPLETEPPSAEVNNILKDLVRKETLSNSGLFAEQLVVRLGESGPLLRNTHRTANFFVLLAPDVPAVLLELGFLTNPSDEARLKTAEGRAPLVSSVKLAIDDYFDTPAGVYAQR